MCKLKTCLIAKPPFTKPPFVNSRLEGGSRAPRGLGSRAEPRKSRGEYIILSYTIIVLFYVIQYHIVTLYYSIITLFYDVLFHSILFLGDGGKRREGGGKGKEGVGMDRKGDTETFVSLRPAFVALCQTVNASFSSICVLMFFTQGDGLRQELAASGRLSCTGCTIISTTYVSTADKQLVTLCLRHVVICSFQMRF